MWTTDGTLRIIDRIQNLVRLKGGELQSDAPLIGSIIHHMTGEYIALEAMEAVYVQSRFVNARAGGVMVYGDGEMEQPVAVVQVNAKALTQWARSVDVPFTNVQDLCANPKAINRVLCDLLDVGRGRVGHKEMVAAVALLPNTASPEASGWDSPWTTQNGYLTASSKLNRKAVVKGLQDVLAPLIQRGAARQ